MNKTTKNTRKTTKTVASATIIASLAVLAVALHGISFPQNVYAATLGESSSGYDLKLTGRPT